MKKLLIAFVVVLVAGCKDKAKDEAKAVDPKPVETKIETKRVDTSAPKTEDKPVATGALKLATAKLTAEGGGQKAELVVQADGKVMLDGNPVGLLNTAGELAIDGKVVATIGADGKMMVTGESGRPIVIREDGAMLDKDGKVALEPKPDGTLGGVLAETELKDTKMKVEGDKAGYRALMFAWMGVSKAAK